MSSLSTSKPATTRKKCSIWCVPSTCLYGFTLCTGCKAPKSSLAIFLTSITPLSPRDRALPALHRAKTGPISVSVLSSSRSRRTLRKRGLPARRPASAEHCLPAQRLFLSSCQRHDDSPSSHKHMGPSRSGSADAHGCALNKSFVLKQGGPVLGL